MGVLSWIVLGLLAGMLARLIMPGRQRGGCILTTLLGIAGGLIGGFLGRQMGYGGVDEFSFTSLLWATGGAFLLLLIFGAFFNRD